MFDGSHKLMTIYILLLRFMLFKKKNKKYQEEA